MEWLDALQREVCGVYRDRRCRQCDFAVRVLRHEIPDTTRVAPLRESLAQAFLRTVPA